MINPDAVCEWVQEGPSHIVKKRICEITEEEYSVKVNLKDFIDWRNGKYAQDAFPMLSREQREFIISGITPAMWDAMFPK